MTKSTKYRTRPVLVTTSTVKKSVAAIAPQWAFRNVFQLVRLPRSGAGSRPASTKIRLIVLRPTSWPRFQSAPRIRVYPQLGFSEAILETSTARGGGVHGRPEPRRREPSYF